jgi:predicted AAA+ superfamily ATPase
LAEHLVTPNIAEKFRALGYAFTRAGPDVEFFDRNGKALTEVDVWLENGDFVMAVEVKSRPRKRDVEDHVKRMGILRSYLDQRNDGRKLLGAIAGAIVTKELRDTIIEQGFYVIEQSGDTVKIEPPTGFEPRIW